MRDAVKLLARTLQIPQHPHFGDQFSRLAADDMCSDNLASLVIHDDLDAIR